MADYVIGIIVGFAVIAAARYIYKAKKSGVRCIGCPSAGTCSAKAEGQGSCGGCGCGCHSDAE